MAANVKLIQKIKSTEVQSETKFRKKRSYKQENINSNCVNSKGRGTSPVALQTQNKREQSFINDRCSRCTVVLENGSKTSFGVESDIDGSLKIVLSENESDPGEHVRKQLSEVKLPKCTNEIPGHHDVVKYSDINLLIVAERDDIECYETETIVTPRRAPKANIRKEKKDTRTNCNDSKTKSASKKGKEGNKQNFGRYGDFKTKEVHKEKDATKVQKSLNKRETKHPDSKNAQKSSSKNLNKQISFRECVYIASPRAFKPSSSNESISKTTFNAVKAVHKEDNTKRKEVTWNGTANDMNVLVPLEYNCQQLGLLRKKLFTMMKFIQRLKARHIFLRHNEKNHKPIRNLLGKGYKRWCTKLKRPSCGNEEETFRNINPCIDLLNVDFASNVFTYSKHSLANVFSSALKVFVFCGELISLIADSLSF